MTAQTPERLIEDGRTYAMRAVPLESYFYLGGARPKLRHYSSALWRRYVGTWEIRDERLYLVGIRGDLSGGGPVSLQDIFPGYPERVFAHWYSGEINIPHGELVKYVHMGFGSRFEHEEIMCFRAGVRTHRSVRRHPRPQREEPWPPFVFRWPGR